MKPGLWHKLDLAARALLPFASSLILVLLSMVPTRVPAFGGVAPMLPLMGVYYWSIAQPELMRPSVGFLVGIAVDLLAGTPLGVNALLFIVVHWAVVGQRRFFINKPFFVGWWAFGLVAFGVATSQWLLISALQSSLVDPWPVLVSYLLTLSLYPVFGWVFAKVEVKVFEEA